MKMNSQFEILEKEMLKDNPLNLKLFKIDIIFS